MPFDNSQVLIGCLGQNTFTTLRIHLRYFNNSSQIYEYALTGFHSAASQQLADKSQLRGSGDILLIIVRFLGNGSCNEAL